MLILIMNYRGDYSIALNQILAALANSNFNLTRGETGAKQNNYAAIASLLSASSSSVVWLPDQGKSGHWIMAVRIP